MKSLKGLLPTLFCNFNVKWGKLVLIVIYKKKNFFIAFIGLSILVFTKFILSHYLFHKRIKNLKINHFSQNLCSRSLQLSTLLLKI